MISWMQKHNKYLVWTIWVATIAFIGAGFVGWGSYDLGSKAGNVAKVGNIEITQSKLNMAYSNVYNKYNEMLEGKMDEKKAKELGLIKQAFATLSTQAKILSFANDLNIVVSDSEIAKVLEGIKGFQKDGIFNKETYDAYLRSQRMKAQVFESTLRDDITIGKVLDLLRTQSLPFEEESVSAAMNIADKLLYKVLSPSDINFTSNETEVKAFWETKKENFMTDKSYILSIVWTNTNDTVVTEDELKAYYEANSFNYTNSIGKQLLYADAKAQVTTDLKLKKSKKSAQKNYIAFKKGKLESSENITLAVGDNKLTKEVWSEIQTKSVGDILKPKIVGNQYATIKINNTIESKVMSYDEAKEKVTQLYTIQKKKEALFKLAESTLGTLNTNNAEVSDFITLEKYDNLKLLNSQESLQFVQKLFTSTKEKGIISVLDKVIVYNIIKQKFEKSDENQTAFIKDNTVQMKNRTFENNFIKMLDKKYTTEVYMEGLTN
ncbi:MAG: SurA N-terminal domain-containing protein [Campylobacterota bacterium]|nr:SurA N-terminal domain-containing protein [Campylobacterota bacterium]